MEFNLDLKSDLVVEPAGFIHQAVPKLGCPVSSRMTWNNSYRIAYLDVLDLPFFASDGLNEAGLSVGSLLFPGFAKFQDIPIDRCDNSVSSL